MDDASINDESGLYAPAGSFVDYEGLVIRRFLERRLPSWRIAYETGGHAAKVGLSEAFGTRAVLNDYIDEGYGKYIAQALGGTGLEEQLDSYLQQTGETGPSLLGDLADRGRVDLVWTPGEKQSLPDFLGWGLELENLPDIDAHFASRDEAESWRTRTRFLMNELAKYVRWVYQQVEQRGWQPVSLLRDALLVHLGLVWLGREDARALLLNRMFADAFGAREEVYVKLLIETLYRDVAAPNSPTDLEELRRRFSEGALKEGLLPPTFVQACRHHVNELGLHAEPCWVESGVNGTFPLWLSALTDNEGGMLLYNTVPWLQGYYELCTFRRDYEYLRDMETIVAHESLFQVDLADPLASPMYVVVSADRQAKDLAAYEAVTLRRLL